MQAKRIDEAIETLGGLVSRAGGEGDEALDVFKDVFAEVGRLREALETIASYDTLTTQTRAGCRRTAREALDA